jgi:hypothetical protein
VLFGCIDRISGRFPLNLSCTQKFPADAIDRKGPHDSSWNGAIDGSTGVPTCCPVVDANSPKRICLGRGTGKIHLRWPTYLVYLRVDPALGTPVAADVQTSMKYTHGTNIRISFGLWVSPLRRGLSDGLPATLTRPQ